MKRGSSDKKYVLTSRTSEWYLNNPELYLLPSTGDIADHHLEEWYLHMAVCMYGKDVRLEPIWKPVRHQAWNRFRVKGIEIEVAFYVYSNGKVGA